MSVDDGIDGEFSGEPKTQKTAQTKQNSASSLSLADMGRSVPSASRLRVKPHPCIGDLRVVLADAGVATDQAVIEEVADADGEGDDAEGGGDPCVGFA
jgi:hypothetical protein